MDTVYIIEHIIVMGPVIETMTHTTLDEIEAKRIFDTYINEPVEEKFLTRLLMVQPWGFQELKSQGSWE
jgi:hypothetical protein